MSRILHCTDFHFQKVWFKWLSAKAPDFDAICVTGDFLDLDVHLRTQPKDQICWISDWVAEFPASSRDEIQKFDPLNFGRLQRTDPKLFEEILPPREKGGRSTNWQKRDEAFLGIIQGAIPTIPSKECSSPTRIMKAAGLSPHFLLTAKGRLPRTQSYLDTLIIPFDTAEDKREKLLNLVSNNPKLGREAIRLLDRTTVDYVTKYDPEFFEKVMPASKLALKLV